MFQKYTKPNQKAKAKANHYKTVHLSNQVCAPKLLLIIQILNEKLPKKKTNRLREKNNQTTCTLIAAMQHRHRIKSIHKHIYVESKFAFITIHVFNSVFCLLIHIT